MAKRIRYTPEQIITKLREAEVRCRVSQGKTVGQACKTLESVTKPTTASAGNTGEWMSLRPRSSKKWKKKIPS